MGQQTFFDQGGINNPSFAAEGHPGTRGMEKKKWWAFRAPGCTGLRDISDRLFLFGEDPERTLWAVKLMSMIQWWVASVRTSIWNFQTSTCLQPLGSLTQRGGQFLQNLGQRAEFHPRGTNLHASLRCSFHPLPSLWQFNEQLTDFVTSFTNHAKIHKQFGSSKTNCGACSSVRGSGWSGGMICGPS